MWWNSWKWLVRWWLQMNINPLIQNWRGLRMICPKMESVANINRKTWKGEEHCCVGGRDEDWVKLGPAKQGHVVILTVIYSFKFKLSMNQNPTPFCNKMAKELCGTKEIRCTWYTPKVVSQSQKKMAIVRVLKEGLKLSAVNGVQVHRQCHRGKYSKSLMGGLASYILTWHSLRQQQGG